MARRLSIKVGSLAATLGKVAVIGDSLTYQLGNGTTAIPAAFAAAGWQASDVTVDGVDGSATASAPARISAIRSAIGEPALWVIALVTNDVDNANFANDIASALTALGSSARLMWVNGGYPNTDFMPHLSDRNATLASSLSGRAKTLYADWYSYMTAHSSQLAGLWNSDQIHMLPAGYDIKNSWMASQAILALGA